MERNVVGWFEIPVTDMARAIRFYEAVLGVELELHEMGELDMAWFPMLEEKPGSPGSLVYMPEFYEPSTTGTIVYFTAQSGDLSNELSRVEDAGGKVVVERKSIGEHGFIAVCHDTEGNTFALHSNR